MCDDEGNVFRVILKFNLILGVTESVSRQYDFTVKRHDACPPPKSLTRQTCNAGWTNGGMLLVADSVACAAECELSIIVAWELALVISADAPFPVGRGFWSPFAVGNCNLQ